MNARSRDAGRQQACDAPVQAESRPGLDRRAKPRVHAQRTDPSPAGELLTVEELTVELRVSRTAFYRWRQQGAGPPVLRLPGGGLRVRRAALAAWLAGLEDETPEETAP